MIFRELGCLCAGWPVANGGGPVGTALFPIGRLLALRVMKKGVFRPGVMVLLGAAFALLPSARLEGAVLMRTTLGPEFVVPQTGGASPAGISNASGTGVFELFLTPGGPTMTYELTFSNLTLADITGIHFHFGHAPILGGGSTVLFTEEKTVKEEHESADGPNGPHLLNVYGLPREDDADLVVDVAGNRISGVWDNFDENFGGDGVRDPGDSVRLADAIDLLLVEEVYVQVHTVDFPAPLTGELRGQLVLIPEPGVPVLGALATLFLLARRRLRS